MFNVQIDSRGIKTLELNHLNNQQFLFVKSIFIDKNKRKPSNQLIIDSMVSISYFDVVNRSIGLIFHSDNYHDFVLFLKNNIQSSEK